MKRRKTTPPDTVTANEISLAQWRLLVPQLAEQNSITPASLNLLEVYCTTFARWHEAELKVRELGTIIKGPTGAAQTNPYLSVVNRCVVQLRQLADSLGLGRKKNATREKQEPHDELLDKFPRKHSA